MDIDKYEMGFFNTQIVSAVASLGFEQPDVDFTNTSLYTVFSNRCSPPAAVIPPDAGEQLQTICVAGNCPLDGNAACGAYPNGGPVEQPVVANASLVGELVKGNETEAAPTAVWPVHCKRDEGGRCEFASGSASAAPSGEAGNLAATTMQPFRGGAVDVVLLAIGMLVAGAAGFFVV